jgi:hypothetical protein
MSTKMTGWIEHAGTQHQTLRLTWMHGPSVDEFVGMFVPDSSEL